MARALLRPCAQVGCGRLVVRGRCPDHTRAYEERRGSAHARGYTRQWEKWRRWYFGALIKFAVSGVGPGAVCGARWPGLALTGDSECMAEGRRNATDLVLDHTPPLTMAERGNPRAVCDTTRVQVLCSTCHATKTAREQAQPSRA